MYTHSRKSGASINLVWAQSKIHMSGHKRSQYMLNVQ